MKKILTIICFLLFTYASFSQAPTIRAKKLVFDESLRHGDSIVTHIYSDTLPNKNYVDNEILEAQGVFENGLIKEDDTIRLGDTLSRNTTIELDGFTFTLKSPTTGWTAGSYKSNLNLGDNGITATSYSDSSLYQLRLDGGNGTLLQSVQGGTPQTFNTNRIQMLDNDFHIEALSPFTTEQIQIRIDTSNILIRNSALNDTVINVSSILTDINSFLNVGANDNYQLGQNFIVNLTEFTGDFDVSQGNQGSTTIGVQDGHRTAGLYINVMDGTETDSLNYAIDIEGFQVEDPITGDDIINIGKDSAYFDVNTTVDAYLEVVDSFSIGGGDILKTSDTININEVVFDSIITKKITSPNDSIIVEKKIVAVEYIGQLYVAGDSTLAIGTADAYFTLNKFQQDLSVNTTLTDSSITTTESGYYKIFNSASYTHGVNNTIVHHSVFVNDVEQTQIETERKIGTGGDVGSSGNSGVLFLNASDVVKIKFKASNTGTITIMHMNFHIFRL